jgi:hypothetical protein
MSRFLDKFFKSLALRSYALSACGLAICGQLAVNPPVLNAQVTFSGVQTTIPIPPITPGGLALDGAGDVVFFDKASFSIMQANIGTGVAQQLENPTPGPVVAWASLGANDGLFFYINGVAGPNQNWVSVSEEVNGTVEAAFYLAGPESATSVLASIALTPGGPDAMVVFSNSTGQLWFATRTGSVWSSPAAIPGALTPGPLTVTLLPLPGGAAFMAFEGTDSSFYWSQYSSGAWSAVAPFAFPGNIFSPAGSGPIGMALDSTGNLFVSGANDNVIWEYPWIGPAIGTVTTLPYSTPVQIAATVNGPTGLAPDNQGNLYISDTGNNRIVRVGLQGTYFGTEPVGSTTASMPFTFNFGSTTTMGATTVLTNGLTGMDFADAGTGNCTSGTTINAGDSCTVNITFTPSLAGYRNGAVVLQDNSGNALAMTYFYGQGLGPQLSFLPGTQTLLSSTVPNYSLTVDGSGDIFVAGWQQFPSVVFPISEFVFAGGTYTFDLDFVQNAPAVTYGLGIDGAGSLYLSFASNQSQGLATVGKYPPAPALFPQASWTAGIGGTGGTSLLPVDIEATHSIAEPLIVDGSGNFYTLDEFGNIIKATLNGNTYTVNEIYAYPGGVPKPQYLTADSAGNLYVGTVTGTQKWTPSGSGYTIQSPVIDADGRMAVDGNGVLYIANDGGGYVSRETPVAGGYTESIVVPASSFGGAQILSLAVDQKGILYVGTANNSVLKVDFTVPPATPFPTATDLGRLDAVDGTETVQALNLGNQPLKFTKVAYPVDFPQAGGDTNACTGSTTLDVGQQCDLPIEFFPQHSGSLSENVTLTDNNLNGSMVTQSIAVSGTATAPPLSVTWATPAAITYGTALSSTQLDAVANVPGNFVYSPVAGTVLRAGTQQLSATFTPTDTTDYKQTDVTTSLQVSQATPAISWTPAPLQLDGKLGAAQLDATANTPGKLVYSPASGTEIKTTTETLKVTFTPTDTTDYTSTSATIALPVTLVSVSPSSINFGTVFLGSSTTKTVKVTNLTSGPVAISGSIVATLPAGNSNGFVVVNECPKSLAAKKSCTMKVEFVADAFYTTQTATLSVTDTPGGPAAVSLSGLIIDPVTSLNPTTIGFGTQKEGTSSVAKSVTLTNTGATTLTIKSVAVSGSDPSDFKQTNNCGSSLIAGVHCTINVTFKPTLKGSRTAKLTITDNAKNSPQGLTLSGTGD